MIVRLARTERRKDSHIRGGKLKVQDYAVLSLDFLNKNLNTNLRNWHIYPHNTCKYIVIFHFLHIMRVFFLLDFLNKKPKLNLKYWHIYFRNICNNN